MGSQVYATALATRAERVIAMLSLETLGSYSDELGSQRYPFPMNAFYPERGNFVAFVGNVSSRALVRQAVGAFRESTPFPAEGAALPELTTGVGWPDHEPFWKIDVLLPSARLNGASEDVAEIAQNMASTNWPVLS